MLTPPKIPRIQPSLTTAKGLVSCWPFFEGTGPVLHDVSGYGLDASITTATWQDAPILNQLELNFNTSGAQALTEAPQYAPSTNTVTMLVRAVSFVNLAAPVTTYQGNGLLLSRHNLSVPICGLALSGNGGGSPTAGTAAPITALWNGTASEYNASTGLFPTVGVTFLAAEVVTPSSLTIWMIDEVGGTQSFVMTQANPARAISDPWTVGNDPFGSGARFWPGAIFEARIYGRALALSEIWDIYIGNG